MLPVASAHLAGFARLLRIAGLAIAPEQIVTFLDAVRLLGPRSMDDICEAALATLAPGPERAGEFDALFRAWFWGEAVITSRGDGDEEMRVKDDRGARQDLVLPNERVAGGEFSSSAEQLATRQFRAVEDELSHFARALPRAVPTRRSFRTIGARHGRPDLRRSLRSIVKSDGDVAQPLLRRRANAQRRLLLLVDISGSMKLHTEGHLQIAHAVVRGADRAEVFALGTRLTRITASLRIADRKLALARAAEAVEDWDGGTRIGPALLALLSVPRFAAFARGAAVVILSDGLERGDHGEMEQAFRRLKARAFRLSLLTPLAADSRFRPRTAALAKVLPHLDDLADGSDIEAVTDFMLSLAKPARRASDCWREAS